MRKFSRLKYLILFLVIVIILPVILLFSLLEYDSSVSETDLPTVEHAAKTRELVKSFKALLRQKNTFSFSVSEDEINSVFIFMHRGVNPLRGHADVTPKEINIKASLRIPRNPFGEYINFRFSIVPSDKAFKVARVYLGKIRIPGPAALYIGKIVVDVASGEKIGSLAVDTVRAVSVDKRKVTLQLRPIPDLRERIAKLKKRFRSVRDSVSLLGDPLLVRIYYTRLIEIDQNLPTKEPISLVSFMGPLFRLAHERGGLPEEENQAAILALAVFLGHGIEGSFIGPVRTDEMKKYKRKRRKVGLGNRTDLRLHFIVSAFLKILSDSGISYAVGEFKELMDARRGGSGFSFIDLAADRAGVKFAATATGRTDEALRIQQLFTVDIQEDAFFPDIKDLPEGITQTEFEQFYQNVEGNEYQALVHAIDQCIASLPAYGHHQEDQVLETEGCRMSGVVPEQLKQVLSNRTRGRK
jgi:hypothetical protein